MKSTSEKAPDSGVNTHQRDRGPDPDFDLQTLQLGAALRGLRAAQRYDRRKQAQLAGLEPVQLTRWEAGTGPLPQLGQLQALAARLGVTTDALQTVPGDPAILFAFNLIRMRRLSGLTQAELGDMAPDGPIVHSTIARYEAGETLPHLRQRQRLAGACGVDVEEFNWRPPPPSSQTETMPGGVADWRHVQASDPVAWRSFVRAYPDLIAEAEQLEHGPTALLRAKLAPPLPRRAMSALFYRDVVCAYLYGTVPVENNHPGDPSDGKRLK